VAYLLRKFGNSLLLVVGVTFLSFVLMVWFGPDRTFGLLGKNPTQQQIEQVRHQLGYDQPFFQRYFDYLTDLATLNLGYSDSSGEAVDAILSRPSPGHEKTTSITAIPPRASPIYTAAAVTTGKIALRRA
jgi:peptide/nickel transport system permease protein